MLCEWKYKFPNLVVQPNLYNQSLVLVERGHSQTDLIISDWNWQFTLGRLRDLPLQVARIRIFADSNEGLEELISGDRKMFFDVVRNPQ